MDLVCLSEGESGIPTWLGDGGEKQKFEEKSGRFASVLS
jgi:hypothetical protein